MMAKFDARHGASCTVVMLSTKSVLCPCFPYVNIPIFFQALSAWKRGGVVGILGEWGDVSGDSRWVVGISVGILGEQWGFEWDSRRGI